MTQTTASWGRVHLFTGPVREIHCWDDIPQILTSTPHAGALVSGARRSYGDVGLPAPGGLLIDASHCDALIKFDRDKGVLCAEAGASLGDLLPLVEAAGWDIPVVPGTAHVSLGGAVANDIHGKNQFRLGSFGNHVTRLRLIRSDGVFDCSPRENPELFQASIGGMGLTGVITEVELALQRHHAAGFQVQRLGFSSWEQFLNLCREVETNMQITHSVAWADGLAKHGLPGYFLLARQTDKSDHAMPRSLGLPGFVPPLARSRFLVGLFNRWHRWRQGVDKKLTMGRAGFLFPLDGVRHWNRLYGRRGMVQYQCVLPWASAEQAGLKLWRVIRGSVQRPHLAVLNHFGPITSPGMMSFCRDGVSVALDFAYRGETTARLLDQLDDVVGQADGRIYPAKDGRVSGVAFNRMYPRLGEFQPWRDPRLQSAFWARVLQ